MSRQLLTGMGGGVSSVGVGKFNKRRRLSGKMKKGGGGFANLAVYKGEQPREDGCQHSTGM